MNPKTLWKDLLGMFLSIRNVKTSEILEMSLII